VGPDETFRKQPDTPVFQEAVEFTEFALSEFKRRADRDGAALVILATHQMRSIEGGHMDYLLKISQKLGIDVIDQAEYIDSVGGNIKEAQFSYDGHWSPKGHEWAAGALMKWLEAHPNICGK
jgi:hypothetical protein